MLAMIGPMRSWGAPPVVKPGETLSFFGPDGGTTECRVNLDDADCDKKGFTNTKADVGRHAVSAGFEKAFLLAELAKAHYATASLFNDFTVSGTSSNVVDAQISVSYNYSGAIGGSAAYKASSTVTLTVEDKSGDGFSHTETLFQQERDGDQGFNLSVSAGGETQNFQEEVAAFPIKLRRGHRYRVTFAVEVLGEALAVGSVQADGQADWSAITVTVGPDVAEQLSQHDADIKQKLADLDKKISGTNAKLDEIKELLLTPQGRRPGFPKK